ncbi:MAG: hypothetical protein DYG89_43515 [Caldilinea sp. CFX5]|nr:hypothetical protein [Caldilinea sp. CFX5]
MSKPQLRFFGPGVIQAADGQPIPMRSRKQLALLVYLATEYQIAHSRETLLALFWPEETTADAQNNLRVTLSRLRELGGKLTTPAATLGATPAAELLIIDRNRVQLHPEWIAHVDVNRFNRLLTQTRQHAHTFRSQCGSCQAALSEAVQLYQGSFLVGLGLDDCPDVEEWLLMQRERLHLLALEAYSDLATYAEASGDLVAARGFAQRQLEIDPLREAAYRQQMRILIKQGERTLALGLFARCRALLQEELGLDPEAETLTLYAQLRNASAPDDGLAEGLRGTVGMPLSNDGVVPAPPRTNLPPQLTPFIGREEELAELHARLATPTYRLLSIIGPGGIGKSRLAQQAAAQQLDNFADGVYWTPLAQTPSAASLPAAIAETVGLTFAATPQSPIMQLGEMLKSRELLLVLDNFEHLMAGVDLLLTLLQQAPKVVLLITSREQLNLQAEDLFELQGLPTPTSLTAGDAAHFAAVRLFVDRARRLDKGFKPTAEQLPHIVRICQLVEGFPLAIELAAAWIRNLTPREIAAEVAAGLDRLATTLRDVDPHHASLRAVFNSSWRLLSVTERRALARLSVFRGGFSVEAARIVAQASLLVLQALRHKSLLRSAGSHRYDMHALVQQFSAEALATDPQEAAAVQRSHSHTFLTLLAEQAVALDTSAARQAVDQIQPDWENVAAAWQDAVTQRTAPLLAAALDGLVYFCDLRGLFVEAQTLLEGAVSVLQQDSNRTPANPEPVNTNQGATQRLHLLCRLLTALAQFAGRRHRPNTSALAQQALTLAYQIESEPEVISNLLTQASVFELAAAYAQGVALAEKALGIAQAARLERHAGLCLDLLGNIAYLAGDFGRAQNHFQQVLLIHEQTGRLEQRGRAAIGYLGLATAELGRLDVALHYSQRYLESCERIEDRRNLAHAQHCLAYVRLRLGYFAQAVALDEQSAAAAEAIGDRDLRSFALHAQSWAYRHLDQFPAALRCATEAVALARALDAPLTLVFALTHLAEAQLETAQSAADWAQATANFQEAATIARTIGKLIAAYEAEIGLAELYRRRGQIAAAHEQIAPLLPQLPTVAAMGWDEPLRAYVVCTHILQAAHDPSAEQILDQGVSLLERLAANITDPNHRQHFLSAIPAHRQLRALRRND